MESVQLFQHQCFEIVQEMVDRFIQFIFDEGVEVWSLVSSYLKSVYIKNSLSLMKVRFNNILI